MPHDSRKETKKHIKTVKKYINSMISELINRANNHDKTKLREPEKSIFDEFTPKLKGSTYGSEEYNGFLESMKEALDHHYFHNRHHPEFFTIGPEANIGCLQSPLERMNLIDIMEMFCDWLAACERHDNGNIYKSIEINQKRFGYSDEIRMILERTANFIQEKKQ